MFFDLFLLRRQHKGRLGFAWIAGTRGIQHVSKKDVVDLDIGALCHEISEYVSSRSDSPRSRFSLRLSALLINGTLKIYRQKAVYVLEDLVKVLTTVSTPAFIAPFPELERTGLIETPPSPVAKKRAKKKLPPVEESTPESQLEKLVADIRQREIGGIERLTFPEEQAVLQARADEVTLRETQLQREERVEEFGILGALPTEEELLRDIMGMEKAAAVPPPTLPPIEEEPQVPVPETTVAKPAELPRERPRLITSSPESETPAGSFVVITKAQVHAPAEFEPPRKSPRKELISREAAEARPVEQPQEVEAMEIEKPGEAPVEVETRIHRRVLGETPLEVIEERDKEIRRVREKRMDEDLSKLLISFKPTRIVRIDRCDPGEVEWVDIRVCPLPEFKLKIPNLTNLVNMYLLRDDRDLQQRKKPSEVSSLEESLVLRRKSGRATPPVEVSGEARPPPPILIERVEEEAPIAPAQAAVEAPQVPIEAPLPAVAPAETAISLTLPTITSTPIKRRMEERTVEEVMAVAAEEEAVSLRKRRRLLDVEPELPKGLDFITLPSELLSRELSGLTGEPISLAETAVEPVPLPVLTEQARQQDIVNKIFISGRLTLEDVCQRPINKMNIARAFNDVLVLCKYKYVELLSKENSLELEYIDRGAKMAH